MERLRASFKKLGGFGYLSNLVLFSGVILVVVGAIIRFNRANPSSSHSLGSVPFGLREHQVAVEQAQRDGKREYHYNSSYIPGIGYITDTQAYTDNQLKQLGVDGPLKQE